MKTKVMLFAAARDLVGHDELSIEMPNNSTIEDLRDLLNEEYPSLSELLPHVIFAVNANYVAGDRLIQDSDEIACIPPVSGG